MTAARSLRKEGAVTNMHASPTEIALSVTRVNARAVVNPMTIEMLVVRELF